jgi:hypothetical protein
MIKEHDIIILNEMVIVEYGMCGLPPKTKGTIIHIYPAKKKGESVYEVEAQGYTFTLVRGQFEIDNNH